MLAQSGQPELIKPVWIERIAAAPQADGGWSPFEPLLPIGANRFPGFSGKGISTGTPRSTFHTTAQGVLLFSILVEQVHAANDS